MICQARDAKGKPTAYYFKEGVYRPQAKSNKKEYYARDHLGSIRDVLDEAGHPIARYDYDPYGNLINKPEKQLEFGYAGMQYHAPSGLYLTKYRAYDPESGRWLSRDPIEETGGINLYAYVNGNPVSYIDPLGLAPNLACVAQCTAAGGVAGSIIGGTLGGVGGALACSPSGPGAGVCAAGGGIKGAMVVGGIGLGVGGIIGNLVCSEAEGTGTEGTSSPPVSVGPDTKGTPPNGAEPPPEEKDDQPTAQDAKDAKRMSPSELDKAAKNNGYKDAHDMKAQLGYDSKTDIFVDNKGRMYAGPRKGTGTPEYLHMKINKS